MVSVVSVDVVGRCGCVGWAAEVRAVLTLLFIIYVIICFRIHHNVRSVWNRLFLCTLDLSLLRLVDVADIANKSLYASFLVAYLSPYRRAVSLLLVLLHRWMLDRSLCRRQW